MEDSEVNASRATEALFYRAPHPDNMAPMAYQFAGVEYALRRKHCLIGDAPGLGKTAEAVLLSNAIEAEWNLVICPASLRLNWEREVWKWSMLPNVSTYPILKSGHGVSSTANYVILSYDLLRNPSILNALMDQTWDHMILDEAHKIKDPKGNQTTIPICAPDLLPSVAGRITLLSGTIMPNQPIEAYNAIRLIDWDAIDRMSIDAFREYYYGRGGGFVRGLTWDEEKQANVYKLHWSDQVRNQPRNLDDLQYRMRRHMMVRRTKDQVLTQLPPKQWHLFPLATTPAMRAALKHPGWKKAEKLYEMDPGAFNEAIAVDGEISTARRELGEAKAPAVADYVEELLLSGTEKVIVGAWHRSVLGILRERLQSHGLTYMDGSTSSGAKQRAVDKFMSDSKVRVILGQTMTLGEGWTLTVAQDVVNAEPDYVPGKNDQLFDRIHRPGQDGGYCICHLPVVPDSMDERIIAKAIQKDQHIFDALDRRE